MNFNNSPFQIREFVHQWASMEAEPSCIQEEFTNSINLKLI